MCSDYLTVVVASLGHSLNFQFTLLTGAFNICKTFGTLQREGIEYEEQEGLFSASKCKAFTFFSYSGTWIMACLLVKYHQVVEHFSTRKKFKIA